MTRRALPLALLALLALAGCARHPDHDPTLDALRAAGESDAERVGAWLMSRPEGMVVLESSEAAAPLVAVHGFASEGTEWVAPLADLGAPGTRFWRWDWRTCPEPAVERLAAAVAALSARPGVARIRLIGHSYGGVIVALLAHRHRGPTPIEAHVVAAPLAGHPLLVERCGPLVPGPPGGGPTRITEWRTVHAADGAFRHLERDPQAADWTGGEVVALPAEWRGGRLGHNRSLRWVAEALTERGGGAGGGTEKGRP